MGEISYFENIKLFTVFFKKMSVISLLFNKKNIRFREGEVIFKENEECANQMFFVDSGMVKIIKKFGDTEKTLTILGSDDFFGDMSLITGSKRFVSAVSLTECNIHAMDKKTFELNILNDKEFMRKILKSLVIRFEETI